MELMQESGPGLYWVAKLNDWYNLQIKVRI